MDANARPARVIAVICGAEVLSMAAYSGFAALIPVLAPEFGLNNSQAGLVSGTVLGGYMATVPFLGALSDRVDARRMYAVAAIVATLGALGFWLIASGFWSALLCQTLIGIGLAGTYVPGMKALTDRLQGRWQSRGAAMYGAAFGIGTGVSLLLCGGAGAVFGWRPAFLLASAGPLFAAAIILLTLRPVAPQTSTPHGLLGFRSVVRNSRVCPYFFITAAHCWELHATRVWLVAFLTYAATSGSGNSMPGSVSTIAALIILVSPVATVTGNEFALRFGRARMMTVGPALSATMSCFLGFLAGSPWFALLAYAALHMYCASIDGGPMLAGVVNAAEPARRGATIALYSLIGFGTGFISPAVFGAVLDLAGGRGNLLAWGLAFATLGAVAMLGVIPARIVARQEDQLGAVSKTI